MSQCFPGSHWPEHSLQPRRLRCRFLLRALLLCGLLCALSACGHDRRAGTEDTPGEAIDRLMESLAAHGSVERADESGPAKAGQKDVRGDASGPGAALPALPQPVPAGPAGATPAEQDKPAPAEPAVPAAVESAVPAGRVFLESNGPVEPSFESNGPVEPSFESNGPVEPSLQELAVRFSGRYGARKPVHWGERLPGITSRLSAGSGGVAAETVVALTFDACGGRKGASYDAGLIAFLRELGIPATIFVTNIWLKANPETLRDLAADPLFEIAAHGARHKPCSVNGATAYGIAGTASLAGLLDEVEGNVREITRTTGLRPRWFRSGTAHYDDVAVDVIRDLGLGVAGYSIAGDEGATLSAAGVAAKTLAAKHGDILLFHLNHPQSGTREGLKRALPQLLERGVVFVRLSEKL